MQTANHPVNIRANKVLIVLLCFWWIINLLQAAFSELANDEAYYFLFSQHLTWGYFDHPPMTPLLIALGSFIGGELGVRLFVTLLQPIYLYLLWIMIRPKKSTPRHALIFFLISFSMPILQLYGFVAVPDAPLLLFTAMLLWSYQRFETKDSWVNVLLIGVSMGCLAYSKYHGALVVIAIIASNPRLLLRRKVYVSALIALLMLLPHLWWQYTHDWASFRYHLIGRNRDFEWSFVSDFLLNVLVVFNPFLFPFFIKGLFSPVRTASERAMRYITVIFILFFTLSTLRGYVQPQWIIVSVFGIISVLMHYFEQDNKRQRYLFIVSACSISVYIILRLAMIFNPTGIRFEVFENKSSYSLIKQTVGDIPILFDGSYAQAAKYNYYGKGESFAQPSIYSRSSQYQLLDTDIHWSGKSVAVQTGESDNAYTIELPNGNKFSYIVIDPFFPVRHIEITHSILPDKMVQGEIYSSTLHIYNPYEQERSIDNNATSLFFVLKRAGYSTQIIPISIPVTTLAPKSSCDISIQFELPQLPSTKWEAGFAISASPITPWFNSSTYIVKTETKDISGKQ